MKSFILESLDFSEKILNHGNVHFGAEFQLLATNFYL